MIFLPFQFPVHIRHFLIQIPSGFLGRMRTVPEPWKDTMNGNVSYPLYGIRGWKLEGEMGSIQSHFFQVAEIKNEAIRHTLGITRLPSNINIRFRRTRSNHPVS